MADKPKTSCPADRFNAIVNDPANRAAINLQVYLLYNRCRHRLKKGSAEIPPPQESPELAPAQANPELAPPQANPEFAPSQASPEIPPSRESPEFAPLQANPEFAPSQASPEIPPSRESPEFAPSQVSPEIPPPQASPEFSPPQAFPEFAPSRASPEFASSQTSPEIPPPQSSIELAPLQASPEFSPPQAFPEFAPSQASPEIPPSRESPEFAPSRESPEIPPPQVYPEIPPLQASPEFSPPRASPEFAPSQTSPDFPFPQAPDKNASPPWFLIEESEDMENCEDTSRPRRTKKPIYRLQVDVNHQTKYTETLSGSQQKTDPSKMPQAFIKLCKVSLPQQQSHQAYDESDRREDHGEKPVQHPSKITYGSDEEDLAGKPNQDPSMVTCPSDEEDWYRPSGTPGANTSLHQFENLDEASSESKSKDSVGKGAPSGVNIAEENGPSKPFIKRFKSVDDDVSFSVKGQSQIKRNQDTSEPVGNECVSDGIEIDIDMTELIEDTDKSQESCESQAETVKDIGLAGNLEKYSSKNGRTTKKKRSLYQSSYKTALSEVSSCLTEKSRQLEILANNNLHESRGKVISEQGDNVDLSAEDADQRSISTIGSRKVTREIGENDLLGEQAEMSENNNVPLEATGTEGGKNWKKNHYISRWVPVLRKKKLYIEGELLILEEVPSTSDSLYASSKILERFSERRVASKNSLYSLEGPLRIPDPAVRPIPLFIIEKFRSGFPEDWKKVVDIWASFTNHQVIQHSASPSNLARFSQITQISSDTGNICSMTNGSLISSMDADSEGNFLARTSTPAKEDLQRQRGAFHSQELDPFKEKDGGVNGAKGKSGKGSSKNGRKMESIPEK